MRAPERPRFRASLNNDGTLEMMVYGDIVDAGTITMLQAYGYDTDGFVSALSIKQQIDAAKGKYSRIALRVNSPGGDAFEGIAAYNILRSQGKPVASFVDGAAASSASIVVMAGDTITMGVNSMLMIHNAWSRACGNATELRKQADVLDKVSDSIGETYVRRTGKSARAISDLMEAESWLSAADCVREGFADDIAEDDDDGDSMALARGFKALSRYKRLPDRLRSSPARSSNSGAENNLSYYQARLAMLGRLP